MNLAERIYAVVIAIDQPLLSLPELRILFNRRKSEFDPAVLSLVADGRCRVHGHDHPFGMSEDQRYELVQDGERFFVGICRA